MELLKDRFDHLFREDSIASMIENLDRILGLQENLDVKQQLVLS